MILNNIHIHKLYEKYDLCLDLNKDINILAGRNGSFKSTLLKLIYDVLTLDNTTYTLSSIVADFSESITAKYFRAEVDVTNSLKDPDFLEKIKSLINPEQIELSEGKRVKMAIGYFDHYAQEKKIEKEEFLKKAKAYYISTFDVKRESKISESVLDAALNVLQSDYGYFLSELAKQITDHIQTEGNISKDILNEINNSKNLFISIINNAFEHTGKRLIENESRLLFSIENERIPVNYLSSGEKQFLIIMLQTLLSRGEECIIIMDEPEISLHIEWQYNLIDYIRMLNPKAQLIISTHSPSIFGQGWGDKVKYMNDIVRKI